MKAQHIRGVSLIEGLVATSIAALVTALAALSMAPWVERLRVESIAAELETDLQLARSAAVARSRSVRFELRQAVGQVCYVIHDGAAGDCPCERSAPVACRAGVTLLRSSSLPVDRGIQASASATNLVFEPVHGAVTPTSSIQINSGPQIGVRLVVNVLGRVRSCATAQALPGQLSCAG